MDQQFQELAGEIAEAVEKRLSGAFEQRIKTHIDQFEQRAELRMKMHFENLDGVVRGAAEGYGVNLDRIERELKDLNKRMDTTLGDHDRVLANHNERITKLEKGRVDDSEVSR